MPARRVVVDLVPPPGPVPGLAGWTGVAVDVLRATSTLTVARANGAAAVVPFADPAAALAFRSGRDDVLACGERGGRIVPGFDLGNSPFEYDAGRVRGRTLAFASTNGSFAMRALANCSARRLGSFAGASALLAALAGAGDVRIVCAGKEGAFALEDAACAGWIAAGLVARGWAADGAPARLALSLAPRDAAEVRALVEGCDHARVLQALGAEYARDVAWCATLDGVDSSWEF